MGSQIATGGFEENGRPRLLKASDVANTASISIRTLWRLVSAGKFPAPIRIGGSTRWRAADLERWIEGGCK